MLQTVLLLGVIIGCIILYFWVCVEDKENSSTIILGSIGFLLEIVDVY